MKKSLLIIAILLASSCVATVDKVDLTQENQFKTSHIDDGNPIKIVPKVEVVNSVIEYEKNLYINEEVSKVCETYKNGDYTEPKLLSRESLEDDYVKQEVSKAIAKYNEGLEGKLSFVTGYLKVDYNNDGVEDILINHSISYYENGEDEAKTGIKIPYNYRYLTVYNNGELKEIVKGVEASYYYQNPYESSQTYIKMGGKNYLATKNKKGKIVRLDLINKKGFPETYCEFGV
ncbi:MAG: hypothetical protein BWY78_00656 [Alphaproteobacteria bacterium ADurb.Bin438]|nr:MAG: hypothetical protein BWY78_00656 [Alphaproteobacteria bacterium ADurb.Bin438]